MMAILKRAMNGNSYITLPVKGNVVSIKVLIYFFNNSFIKKKRAIKFSLRHLFQHN